MIQRLFPLEQRGEVLIKGLIILSFPLISCPYSSNKDLIVVSILGLVSTVQVYSTTLIHSPPNVHIFPELYILGICYWGVGPRPISLPKLEVQSPLSASSNALNNFHSTLACSRFNYFLNLKDAIRISRFREHHYQLFNTMYLLPLYLYFFRTDSRPLGNSLHDLGRCLSYLLRSSFPLL